jgi:NADH dehydrogenase
VDVVTGAFGYIGKHIARRLLEAGREVRTITTHPDKPSPFGAAVQAFPYSFGEPERLRETLTGTDTLFNTYWIRFPYAHQTFESAVANTRTLFECARGAGVKRIIHISVTNCSLDSRLPYYRGKAMQERLLAEIEIPYSIVRPTLVFGDEDILVNNMAWLIRTFPVFPIFGSGKFRVQPVFVEDLAGVAVEQSSETGNFTLDAIGPETVTFEQAVRLMARVMHRRTLIVRVRPALGLFAGRLIGLAVRDVILTRDELDGLMQELLTSEQQPNCPTRFSDWVTERRQTIGRRYTSEIARHFRWERGRPD